MILDTNAVSAFFEDVPAVCSAVGGVKVLAVPSIVLGECRFGLSGSRLRAEFESKLGRLERLAEGPLCRCGDCPSLRRDPARIKGRGNANSRQRSLDRCARAAARTAAAQQRHAFRPRQRSHPHRLVNGFARGSIAVVRGAESLCPQETDAANACRFSGLPSLKPLGKKCLERRCC